MTLNDNVTSAYALLRMAFGTLLIINGWNKWIALPDASIDFPDPLGIGPVFSIYLAIFAELIGGLAILVGFRARLASLPVIATFIVAVFLVHARDSFDEKQVAILYLVTALYILLAGSGRLSVDGYLQSLNTREPIHANNGLA